MSKDIKVENFLKIVRIGVERDGCDMEATLAFMYAESSIAQPVQPATNPWDAQVAQERKFNEGQTMIQLKPCPFCGTTPTHEPWHGGSADKIMIMCDYASCDVRPQVTGETPDEAANSWNNRAQPKDKA